MKKWAEDRCKCAYVGTLEIGMNTVRVLMVCDLGDHSKHPDSAKLVADIPSNKEMAEVLVAEALDDLNVEKHCYRGMYVPRTNCILLWWCMDAVVMEDVLLHEIGHSFGNGISRDVGNAEGLASYFATVFRAVYRGLPGLMKRWEELRSRS